MDATIHQLLHEKADGHTRLCEALGSKGIGLKDANLYFRSPSTQGPRLVYSITGIDWSNRSLTIRHEADIGTRRVLEGHETRGVFYINNGRMAAAEVAAMRLALAIGTARTASPARCRIETETRRDSLRRAQIPLRQEDATVILPK